MYGSYDFTEGELPPSLSDDSPLFLLQSLLETILQLVKIAKNLIPKVNEYSS